ncbi:MAG: phosphate signaling complex protein PhoU [Anaerolineae bacterium]
MRIVLSRQLSEVRSNLLDLGAQVERALAHAMTALSTRDGALAQEVIQNDQRLNELRYAIEEQCVEIMARHQPMARDLRDLLTAVNLAQELERIADHAKGIAVLSLRLEGGPMPPDLSSLQSMATDAQRILRHSLDAYAAGDAAMAYRAADEDAPINARYKAVTQSLVEFMASDPSAQMPATYLLWIAHNIERTADRATNIAERVIFQVTGEMVDFGAETIPGQD